MASLEGVIAGKKLVEHDFALAAAFASDVVAQVADEYWAHTNDSWQGHIMARGGSEVRVGEALEVGSSGGAYQYEAMINEEKDDNGAPPS